jgi:EmrB/QacA subfamily drug resistance transporter
MTRSQRYALVLTSLASLMVTLDMLVVTTALPTMRAHLGATVGQLEWTVNAYTLSFAVLLLPAAALGDRFGRRRLMAAGLGLFTLASATCALVPSAGWLVAARTVQGAGSALVMALAMALLSAAFPPEGRARALGLFSGITGLATLGGPIVGGAVVQALSWPWIFWLNVPIGAALVPLVARHLEESFGTRARVDWGGLVLAAAGAFGLVYGLVMGGSAGWGSTEVVVSLGAGACLLVLFAAWEQRAPEPMLPAQLFARRTFSAGNGAGVLLYGAIYGTAFFMAQFLETGLHYGPLATGLRLMPWTATLFFVAPRAGALVSRVGERPLMVLGLAAQALGFAWVALIAGPNLAYPTLVAPLVLAGCGVSMAMPAAQNAVIGAVPGALVGKASGTFNTLRLLGGSFGIAIAAGAFSQAGSYSSPSSFSHGFIAAMGACAALSLAASLVALAVPGRKARRALILAGAAEPVALGRLETVEAR